MDHFLIVNSFLYFCGPDRSPCTLRYHLLQRIPVELEFHNTVCADPSAYLANVNGDVIYVFPKKMYDRAEEFLMLPTSRTPVELRGGWGRRRGLRLKTNGEREIETETNNWT
ncbi:hypothetical protein JTB14_027594 [Gonioctena quinquepunctata]|nr:hypothetical protein JTB14_027594 [Gonioctena quinquepunctata]